MDAGFKITLNSFLKLNLIRRFETQCFQSNYHFNICPFQAKKTIYHQNTIFYGVNKA